MRRFAYFRVEQTLIAGDGGLGIYAYARGDCRRSVGATDGAQIDTHLYWEEHEEEMRTHRGT